MFENLRYIPEFTETYSSELSQIEGAAEAAAAYVEKQRAYLTRRDGTPVYAPEEHRDREAAILEKAGADFDAQVARYIKQSEREVADIEKQMALLDRDPLDALKPDEAQRAASHREFIKENCATLPAHELARRVHAAIAADDKAVGTLYARYLATRDDASGPDLRDVVRELETFLGHEDRMQRRRDLEEKARAAKALPLALSTARRSFDGGISRLMAVGQL